jgi:hypothetical protein
MNREDFQHLAEDHLRHAKVLLEAGLYSGAYYMCGYVVECALKACICRRTNQFDFYPNPNDAKDAWSHDFKKLIRVSDLEGGFNAAREKDKDLDVNWKSVEGWKPESRYESRGQQEAQTIFEAISDPDHGVLSCIRQYW